VVFDGEDGLLFELNVPDESELGLRTVTLKECRLSMVALEGLLKLYRSGVYPNFEGIILIQCAGISRESLRGIVGSEYVMFGDD
jgi:hypothetical protein